MLVTRNRKKKKGNRSFVVVQKCRNICGFRLYVLNLLVQSGVVFLLWWLGLFVLSPWISAIAVAIFVFATYLYL